jgi:hypothetical protein
MAVTTLKDAVKEEKGIRKLVKKHCRELLVREDVDPNTMKNTDARRAFRLSGHLCFELFSLTYPLNS